MGVFPGRRSLAGYFKALMGTGATEMKVHTDFPQIYTKLLPIGTGSVTICTAWSEGDGKLDTYP